MSTTYEVTVTTKGGQTTFKTQNPESVDRIVQGLVTKKIGYVVKTLVS